MKENMIGRDHKHSISFAFSNRVLSDSKSHQVIRDDTQTVILSPSPVFHYSQSRNASVWRCYFHPNHSGQFSYNPEALYLTVVASGQ